jgi:hypothetical protein
MPDEAGALARMRDIALGIVCHSGVMARLAAAAQAAAA